MKRHSKITNRIRSLVAVTFFLALSFAEAQAQCPTNVNLIANADAEAQQTLTGNTDHDVSGWVSETGSFTVIPYGQPGGFPTATSPGPAVRGNYFFAGGPSSAIATASQTFDISACAALVDTGTLPFSVSGYFGGVGPQNDRARLQVNFKIPGDILIGQLTIGDVFASDRGNSTGLLQRSNNGTIPIGARSIEVILFMIPSSGQNDGIADELSLSIPLAPTAADVTVSGRVTDQYGRSVSRAIVTLADMDGSVLTALTNQFGYFVFTDVPAGQGYVLSVMHKSLSFSPQFVNVDDSVDDLLFVAEQ